jgi:MinD-like ATPase involved in chromosome partitioning or flagellar assembly
MPSALDDRTVPVVTAIVNPSLEAELVAGFGRHELGVTVVRRCVDLVELLSAAAGGTARIALLSADLRGLDREALAQLGGFGLAVVGLADSEAQERLLHQLGASLVVPSGASPEQVAGAILAAADAEPGPPPALGAARRGVLAATAEAEVAAQEQGGHVIAVWGPAGAPGRTTVALGIAGALAARGVGTLLVDADPYGGTVATYTGQLDESPGIAAACRAANAGLLDVPRLAECCREISPALRVLTGLSHPARWPELRPASLEVVIGLARLLTEVTLIDTGFCLEEDEELSYDTLAPQRNAATLAALRASDQVVVVASADPAGIARLVRELPRLCAVLDASLAELVSSGRVVVVANRVRQGLLPGDAERGVMHATQEHAGLSPAHHIPSDPAAADAAHGHGELLSEAAAQSGLQRAIAQLAGAVWAPSLASTGVAKRGHRRRIRPGQKASKVS